MHNNRNNGRLNGAKILGSMGVLMITLKRIVSGPGRAQRQPVSRPVNDYLVGTWENQEMTRRRLSI